MKLRILYTCVRCRRIGEGDGYNLKFMYGSPAVCAECQKNA